MKFIRVIKITTNYNSNEKCFCVPGQAQSLSARVIPPATSGLTVPFTSSSSMVVLELSVDSCWGEDAF